MQQFKTKTVRFGKSLYLLVPMEYTEENNVSESEYFQVTLQRLIPEPEEEVLNA